MTTQTQCQAQQIRTHLTQFDDLGDPTEMYANVEDVNEYNRLCLRYWLSHNQWDDGREDVERVAHRGRLSNGAVPTFLFYANLFPCDLSELRRSRRGYTTTELSNLGVLSWLKEQRHPYQANDRDPYGLDYLCHMMNEPRSIGFTKRRLVKVGTFYQYRHYLAVIVRRKGIEWALSSSFFNNGLGLMDVMYSLPGRN